LLEHVFAVGHDSGTQPSPTAQMTASQKRLASRLGVSLKRLWNRLMTPSAGIACGTRAWR
jgi:hypothetical protein